MTNKINLDTDVAFCERLDSDVTAIKIKSGKYKDVIYTYGKISIHENKEMGTCSLKYDFQVQEPIPADVNKNIDKEQEFQNYIGDILMTIIEEKMDDKLTKSNT